MIKYPLLLIISSAIITTVQGNCSTATVIAPSTEDSFDYNIIWNETVPTSFDISTFTTSNTSCFTKTMHFVQPNTT